MKCINIFELFYFFLVLELHNHDLPWLGKVCNHDNILCYFVMNTDEAKNIYLHNLISDISPASPY